MTVVDSTLKRVETSFCEIVFQSLLLWMTVVDLPDIIYPMLGGLVSILVVVDDGRRHR